MKKRIKKNKRQEKAEDVQAKLVDKIAEDLDLDGVMTHILSTLSDDEGSDIYISLQISP